jgi:hypothetical protein
MKDFKDYICSFEQSKKLKELGVKQNSFLYYGYGRNYIYTQLFISDDIEKDKVGFVINIITGDLHKALQLNINANFYAAFTSQELCELIKENECENSIYNINIEDFFSKENKYIFNFLVRQRNDKLKSNGEMIRNGFYPLIDSRWCHEYIEGKNQVQALAEFLIYLLETKMFIKDIMS